MRVIGRDYYDSENKKLYLPTWNIGWVNARFDGGYRKNWYIIKLRKFWSRNVRGSNGEVIFLDGIIYHADETGKINQLSGEELTPYAAVTNFESDVNYFLSNVTDDTVKNWILDQISHNLFAAVKIEGLFKNMHVRVAPKQEKPYPRFVEIARNQPEFEAEDITGTIVGFLHPDYSMEQPQQAFIFILLVMIVNSAVMY